MNLRRRTSVAVTMARSTPRRQPENRVAHVVVHRKNRFPGFLDYASLPCHRLCSIQASTRGRGAQSAWLRVEGLRIAVLVSTHWTKGTMRLLRVNSNVS